MQNKIDTEYQEGRTLTKEGFNLSNPIEAVVYELITEIDKTNDQAAKSKLVRIAITKPLSFSPRIQSYLSEVAVSKSYNLKSVATDILILLSDDNDLKLRLAVGACDAKPSRIVSDYVADQAEHLDPNQIRQVLASLAYRAVPYSLGFKRPYVDKAPLLAVAMAHP